jgi:glutamyl-tRNA reductase
LLNKLFQRTFAVAKSVRSETEIGAATVSMAAAAVGLAQRIYPSISEQSALFIGAGEMIELTATHFAAQHPRRMTFANRTLERAQALAHRFNARAIELRELAEQLHEHDIVVSSTASSLPILGKGMVERALKARRRLPMFMVDLAVPRDIDPRVGGLEDVYLYTIDDLRQVVDENVKARQEEATAARHIIDEAVRQFMSGLKVRDAVPAIRELRGQAEAARAQTLEQARRMLAAGHEPEEVLEYLASTLTNRLLHAPSAALRDAAECGDATLAEAAARLFRAGRDPQ